MKTLIGAALACAVMGFTPAAAAVVTYNEVIDLDASQLFFEGWRADLLGGNFALSVGDTLQGTITFANAGRVTVGTRPSFEAVSVTFPTAPEGTQVFFNTSLTLLGLEGDFIGDNPSSSSLQGSSVIAAQNYGNLTETAFSFSGLSFSMVVTGYSGGATSVVFDPWLINAAGKVSLYEQPVEGPGSGQPVPEPSTWALMIAGMGGAGAKLRRRRSASLA